MKSLIFTNHHVELILSGRKTETRRLVKDPAKSPCQPGDLVWVREAFWQERTHCLSDDCERDNCDYPERATGEIRFSEPWIANNGCYYRKISPIFLPKSHSRLMIEVTGCRLERLLDITAGALIREGYASMKDYLAEWDRLNPETPAHTDPLVWVIAFRAAENGGPK